MPRTKSLVHRVLDNEWVWRKPSIDHWGPGSRSFRPLSGIPADLLITPARGHTQTERLTKAVVLLALGRSLSGSQQGHGQPNVQPGPESSGPEQSDSEQLAPEQSDSTRLLDLYSHVPPWATGTILERQEQAEQIASVEWSEKTRLSNQALYSCPVADNRTKSFPDGDCCFCKDLEPVPLLLSPMDNDPTSWQVVSHRVAVFKPKIDSALPPLY